MAYPPSVSNIVPPSHSQVAPAGTDTVFTRPTRSFRCDTAGDLVCRYAGDDTDRTITLVAGVQESGALTHVRRASTAAITGQW